MADLEKIISLFEKDIESINIADYIPDYIVPQNKNQQWIDKLEFSREAGRNWSLEMKGKAIINDQTQTDYDRKWRKFIAEELHSGDKNRHAKIREFEDNRQKLYGTYEEPEPETNVDFMFDPYNSIFSSLWDVAFEKVNEKYPRQFRKGNIKGKCMTLERLKPGNCIISGKHHKRENSYITVSETSKSYKFALGCNRGCTYSMRNIKLKNMGCTSKSRDEMED